MKNKILHPIFMLSKYSFYGLIIQLLTLSFVCASKVEAQKWISVNEVKINLGFYNEALVDVFSRIESETGYDFSYYQSDINPKIRITLKKENRTVGDLLLKISEEANLAFKQINNTINVRKIKKAEQELMPRLKIIIQTQTVSGNVTSFEDGEGLPGVNIIEKGTSNGTVTDVQGNYSIDVSEDAILVFSSVGYTSIEVDVNNRSVINLAMTQDIQQLQELVVVGYGEQKKATITGSVTSVEGKKIIETPVTNVSNTLAGRLPGLVTVTRSGEPGYDGSTLRIRGMNTLGDNDPLIVVDGIPGRSLDRIDPNSIESISVLKDASAAIYGARAANGVILITTKRGKVGKPVIEVNLNQGYGRPTRIPEMANAAEYATMLNEIDLYKGVPPRYTDEEIQKFRDGSDPWRYPDTDWFDEVLKPWSGQNYGNVTVSGGSENLRYFLMLGAKSQDGYYQNSATKYTQYDFRTNLDGNISDNIKIGFDVAGRQENRNFPTRGAGAIFRMVMRGKPNMHAYWPDGTPGPDIEYGDNPAVVSTDATGYDKDTWYILNSNLNLDIKIPWIDGLSFKANAGIDKGFQFRKLWQTPWYLYSWDYQTYDDDGNPVLTRGKKGFNDPRLSENMEENQTILLNALLNYEFNITSDHSFNILVGTERRTGKGNRFNAFRRYFVSTAIDQMFAGGESEMNTGGSAFQSARLNYFGRTNYNFKEKYLLEFVWRYDGSYIFPEGKRYGFFPGISAGWRVAEEPFWNVSFIDDFKLRASWGQTGNDRIDEYQFLSSYAFGRWDTRSWSSTAFKNAPLILGIDQENKALYEALIPNENVTWEIANQSNVGFELGFFQNKLTFEADYFYNKRTQILWWRNASIPNSTGITLPRENIGKVANRGFDYSIGYNGELSDFSYQLILNGGYAKNEILFWDETPGAPEYQQSTGYPMNTSLYYEAIGIFKDEESLNNYPHISGARTGDIIFKDVNDDGVIDGNDRVRNYFNDIPRYTGGMSLGMQYKGFDLSVLLQGAAGAVQYISTESGEIGNFLKSFYDDRWTQENPNSNGPRTFNRDNEYWRNNQNTHFLHKTNYLRLKNLQLGYSLSQSLIENWGMQNLRFYISGFNLLTYSPDFKDFDPEMNENDGQGYPLQKVINGGLTLTF